MRLLRNLSRNTIDTNFNGRPVHIGPKATGWYEDDKAQYLLITFGFLRDDTPKVKHSIGEVRKARGVRTK